MLSASAHELVTNSGRRSMAPLSVPKGTVYLSWRLEEADGEQTRVIMTWREVDGPEITPPERKGFGTRLLEDVVARELNGEAKLNYEVHGLHYNLCFSVDRS